MNHYILIWSVCTFVESRVCEEIHPEEFECPLKRADRS